jgi:hypothetical protein
MGTLEIQQKNGFNQWMPRSDTLEDATPLESEKAPCSHVLDEFLTNMSEDQDQACLRLSDRPCDTLVAVS